MSLSCVNESKHLYTYVDCSSMMKNLSCKPLFSSDNKMLTDIEIIDSFMVVIQRMRDTCILIINQNSQQIIAHAGIKGRGPNEVIDIDYIRNIKKDSIGRLFFDDVNNKKLLFMNFRDKDSRFVLEKLMDYPAAIFPCSNLCISSNYIIGRKIETDNKNMFFIYNQENDRMTNILFSPEIKGLERNINYFYASHLAMNDRKNTIVAGMYFFDMIQLYDLQGNQKRVVHFSKNWKPNVEKQTQMLDFSKGLSGISFMYATDGYCYIKRRSVSPLQTPNGIEERVENMIVQMDWNGNLIKTYNISEELIGQFCVDEESGKIFAIQHQIEGIKEFYNIVYYDMNE